MAEFFQLSTAERLDALNPGESQRNSVAKIVPHRYEIRSAPDQ